MIDPDLQDAIDEIPAVDSTLFQRALDSVLLSVATEFAPTSAKTYLPVQLLSDFSLMRKDKSEDLALAIMDGVYLHFNEEDQDCDNFFRRLLALETVIQTEEVQSWWSRQPREAWESSYRAIVDATAAERLFVGGSFGVQEFVANIETVAGH